MVRRAGNAVQVPQTASLDVRQAFQSLEGTFVNKAPQQPIKLPEFPSTALPSASEYAWSIIAVTDLGVVATSNGSAWVTTDGSAI